MASSPTCGSSGSHPGVTTSSAHLGITNKSAPNKNASFSPLMYGFGRSAKNAGRITGIPLIDASWKSV